MQPIAFGRSHLLVFLDAKIVKRKRPPQRTRISAPCVDVRRTISTDSVTEATIIKRTLSHRNALSVLFDFSIPPLPIHSPLEDHLQFKTSDQMQHLCQVLLRFFYTRVFHNLYRHFKKRTYVKVILPLYDFERAINCNRSPRRVPPTRVQPLHSGTEFQRLPPTRVQPLQSGTEFQRPVT